MLESPLSKFGKFKLWVWNSYKTWSYVSTQIIYKLNQWVVSFFIGVFFGLLVLEMLFGGFIITLIAYIIGKIFFNTGLLKALLVTLLILGSCTLLLMIVPSLIYEGLYFITYNVTKTAFGIIGIVVGILTSFMLIFTEPKNYWLQHEQAERTEHNTTFNQLRVLLGTLRGALRGNEEEAYVLPAEAMPMTSARQTQTQFTIPDQKFLKFANFNPNIPIINDLVLNTKRPLTDEEQNESTIIKASDGNYYLKAQFEQAKNEDRLSNVTYDPTDEVPLCLKVKFVANNTVCAITQNSIDKQEQAVRTIYGDYYDETSLLTWLEGYGDIPGHSKDPQNKGYLSIAYISKVDQIITLEERPLPLHRQEPSWHQDNDLFPELLSV